MSKTIVISKRQNLSCEQKRQALAELAASGETVKAFCKNTGHSISSINLWKKQHKMGQLMNTKNENNGNNETTHNGNGNGATTTMPATLGTNQTTDLAVLNATNEALRNQVNNLSEELFQCYAWIGKNTLQNRTTTHMNRTAMQ